ncbi:MAG: hypothetical protein FWD33_00660 [Alphaproteobacteria bacterium]|nr:hypothetical protein [Alphaproteobacteria bacterium]
MRKIILGVFGLVIAVTSSDAAVLRGQAMVAGRANQPGLVNIVRAAGTPDAARSAVDVATMDAMVQVVNPNTGNVMLESFLPDGTTLYTDPMTNEKFVMVDGALVAYIDEDDRMIPHLNVTVREAREVCTNVNAHGFEGEFNELTFECMVPIVALGQNGKVISSGDGDAVAFYPFGSVVQCNANTFDSIRVMRRTSQYVIPALIVGGAGVGAAVGHFWPRGNCPEGFVSANNRCVQCPENYVPVPDQNICINHQTERIAVMKESKGGTVTDLRPTRAEDLQRLANQNAASATSVSAPRSGTSGEKFTEFQKELDELDERFKKEDIQFWCDAAPRNLRHEIGSIFTSSKTWNCLAQSEFASIYRADGASPQVFLTSLSNSVNNARMLLQNFNKLNDVEECRKAAEFGNFVNNNVRFNYVANGTCGSITGPMITISYNINGQWTYFGETRTSVPQGEAAKNRFMADLNKFGIPQGGGIFAATHMSRLDSRVTKLSQLANEINDSLSNAEISVQERNELLSRILRLEQEIETVTEMETIPGVTAEEKKGWMSRVWGNRVARGAIIGAGAGAAIGIAYWFYEGSRTKCDVGGFQTVDLGKTYRLPTFREHIQRNPPMMTPVQPVPMPTPTPVN